MTREIKFRAWDKTNKKMYPSEKTDNPKGLDFGVMSDGEIWIWNRLGGTPVDDLELLQYTGLTDKKGKAIYEGDIVRTDRNYFKDNWIVKDIREIFAIENDYNIDSDSIEVIGNVHENPELLGD